MKIKLVYDKDNRKKEVNATVTDATNNTVTGKTVIANTESNSRKKISKINKLANGVVGLTKSTLGLGLASKEYKKEEAFAILVYTEIINLAVFAVVLLSLKLGLQAKNVRKDIGVQLM